jgi:hypothetical protein
MKPRLESAPFTDEDCVAWARALWQLPPMSRWVLIVLERYQAADRRDADIMCKAGHWRRDGVSEPLCFTGATLPWPYELVPIDCGGAVGVYL